MGCAVFLYCYLDVGNTQAAHGRAPAVALGHKLANPGSIVVSCQGDGDLASIGLAEVLHAAQLGLPITFIFINNAIYGMTGVQMAPTNLMGQHTATSPVGRNEFLGKGPGFCGSALGMPHPFEDGFAGGREVGGGADAPRLSVGRQKGCRAAPSL